MEVTPAGSLLTVSRLHIMDMTIYAWLMILWIGLCRGDSPRPSARIVGGTAAGDGEFPFQVSLQHGDSHFCGGSILSKTAVLTAAHCIEDYKKKPEGLSIVAGTNNLNVAGTSSDVKRITRHRRYNTRTLNKDVAVLCLKTPLVYSDKIENVALPSQQCGYPADDTNVTISGWGSTVEGGPISPQLQVVTTKVVSRAACQAKYANEKITKGMLCAGELDAGGKDSCQGDSGGPLIITSESGAVEQLGIVSWGYGCAAPEYPGVYTNICQLRKWIIKTMKKCK